MGNSKWVLSWVQALCTSRTNCFPWKLIKWSISSLSKLESLFAFRKIPLKGASYWESGFICPRWQKASLLTSLVDYFIASKAATQQDKKTVLHSDSIPTVTCGFLRWRHNRWTHGILQRDTKDLFCSDLFTPAGLVILEEEHEVLCGFGPVDDQLCFWENPICVIPSMSMTSWWKRPVKTYFHPRLLFIKWVIAQTMQLLFCHISESDGQKQSEESLDYPKTRLLILVMPVLCCCSVWIHTTAFLSMPDSCPVSVPPGHSCWEGLND